MANGAPAGTSHPKRPPSPILGAETHYWTSQVDTPDPLSRSLRSSKAELQTTTLGMTTELGPSFWRPGPWAALKANAAPHFHRVRVWRLARRWGHGYSELLLHPEPLPAHPGVCTAGKTPSADHIEQRAGKSAPGTPAHLAKLEGLQGCRGPLQMPPRGQALEVQGRHRAVGTKSLMEVTVGSWGRPSTPACPDPGPGGCLQLRTPCAIRPPGPQEGNTPDLTVITLQ